MQIDEPHYALTAEDALAAHQAALKSGGLEGMPNPGLVQSAIARPYNGHYESLAEKCAALTESMATNHGFADGNKRTTIILAHVLVIRSGCMLRPLGDELLQDALESMVLAVVAHEMTLDDVAAWFEARIHKRKSRPSGTV